MQPVLFQFRVSLTDLSGGVAFHHWFPEGASDALTLDTGYQKATLRVWFEKKDVSDGSLSLQEEQGLAEVGPEVLAQYGVLWSGPLSGELKVVENALSREQITALERTSNEVIPEHSEVAKRVLELWICPQVKKFIHILRFHFGQYWLKEFKQWDSRYVDLSSYCHSLYLRVSTDEGRNFRPLSLGRRRVQQDFSIPTQETLSQYITKEDWQEVPNLAKQFKEPNVAIGLVSHAHELVEVGDARSALIEAITALEIAIRQPFIENLQGSRDASESAEAFWREAGRLRTKVAVVGALLMSDSLGLIDQVLKAVSLRNDIAHKGVEASENAKNLVFAVLKFVLFLLKSDYRLVSRNVGNHISTRV